MEKILAELEELRGERQKLEDKVTELQALVEYYKEQHRLAQHKKYGASSEKTENPNQLLLFDEAENEAVANKAEPTEKEVTYIRRARPHKEDNFSELPVEKLVHDLPEEERACPECGEQMHVMGHDTRRELEIIPAQVRIVEHVREVYSCRKCEKEGTSVPVTKAPQPESVIKGGIASASFVAHIMTQKYMNGLPLYRQEQDFFHNGFMLSRQTMANWIIRSSADWLEPLYELMKNNLLGEEVLHADETVLQVLKEVGKASRSQSYMWLYRTSGVSSKPVVLYEYQPTRSSSHPKRFLAGYRGYLHADGYSGYHSLSPGIHVVGCWAHARRKFDDAVKSAPPEERSGLLSQKGLEFCNKLFELEREYEEMSPDERHKERLMRSKAVSDEFFAWAQNVNVLPKSAFGKAVRYALEQRPYLERVFQDGRLELSNNRAERSIKPFVIGRKNWLFSNTPKGAKASSVIYSIIETAKENGLKPFEYLKYLFETMPNVSKETFSALLPWSETLPAQCRQIQTTDLSTSES